MGAIWTLWDLICVVLFSVLFLQHIVLCYGALSERLDGILQAGAPFGSCKNVTVPNTSPVTNTAGSFTGSVQFSSSASTVLSPSCLILFFFCFPLMKFLL